MGSWVIAFLLLLHWLSAAISYEMNESTHDTVENVHNDDNGTEFKEPFRPSKKLLTVLTTKVKRDFQISNPAEETFIYQNNGDELSTTSYFDTEENDDSVKGQGVILYEIDEDQSKTQDEVHYHDHKHYHEHEHKQEHVHQHEQENSHIHNHSHKHNGKHQHNKLEYHGHEHKGTHFHAHEGIHRHNHRGNHEHKHNQAKGHHHKRRHSKDKSGSYCGSKHRRVFKKKPKRSEKF